MAAFAGEISILRGKDSGAGGTIVGLRCRKRRAHQMAGRHAAATVTGTGTCPQWCDRARERISGKTTAGGTSRRGNTGHARAHLQGSRFTNRVESRREKIFAPRRRNLFGGLRKNWRLLVRHQRRNHESAYRKDETRY